MFPSGAWHLQSVVRLGHAPCLLLLGLLLERLLLDSGLCFNCLNSVFVLLLKSFGVVDPVDALTAHVES